VPDFIDNLFAADNYTPQLTLGPTGGVKQIVFSVLGNPALVQFWIPQAGAIGKAELEPFERIYVAGSFGVLATGVSGVQFRNAVVAAKAQIIAEMAYENDPQIIGGALSGVQINAQGQIV
jgi:uncharacterized membrane protein YedE/YeeE